MRRFLAAAVAAVGVLAACTLPAYAGSGPDTWDWTGHVVTR